MVERSRAGRIASIIGILAVSLITTGCGFLQKWRTPDTPPIKTQSEVEVGLAEIDVYWLDECKRMPPYPGRNAVGDIVQDSLVSMGRLAECSTMHNQLVRYLRPLIQKARAGRTEEQKP